MCVCVCVCVFVFLVVRVLCCQIESMSLLVFLCMLHSC